MRVPRRTPEEVRAIIAQHIPEGIVQAEHTATAHYYRHTPSGLLLPSVTTITGILGGGDHLKKWAAQLAVDHIEERIEIFKSLDLSGRTDLYRAAVLAHKDTFEDAGGIGTEGHGVAEAYIKEWLATGVRPADIREHIAGDDYRLWAIARSAQKAFTDFYAIPVASELKVAHVFGRGQKKEGYAGTLDALMYLAFVIREGDKNCSHDVQLVGAHWRRLECTKCQQKWQYYLCLVDFKTSNTIWKFPTPPGKPKQLKDEYVIQVTAYDKALQWMAGIKVDKIVVLRLDKGKEKYEIGEVYDRPGAYKAFLGIKKGFDWFASEKQKSASLETKERVNVADLPKPTKNTQYMNCKNANESNNNQCFDGSCAVCRGPDAGSGAGSMIDERPLTN